MEPLNVPYEDVVTILSKSLSNDNDERNMATRSIGEIIKNPYAFQEFWRVVVKCNNPDIRQAAATYALRSIQKKKQWLQHSNRDRNLIKGSILERIHLEPEKKVKTLIVQAAGQIALSEPDNWPELFRFMEETVGCEERMEMRELGMFLISILTEHASTLFELHVPSMINLFGSILTKMENYGTPLGYLTVISMKNFLLHYPKKEKQISQSFEFFLPSILEVVKAQSAQNRQDRSVECLQFFEALLDTYPRIISSNLKNIIEGLLQAAIFLNVDVISCRMFDVISTIICNKTKKVARDEAILQILCQTIYEIISSPKSFDGTVDHYNVFNGDVNIINTSVDLLDTLTTEIEPDLLFRFIMPILDNAVMNDNPFGKKAVYIILGVLVEHCPQQIRNAGSERILLFIKEGLNSENDLLINGALFALWRFIENFKPHINIYMLDFVSLLLQLLSGSDGRLNKVEGHLIPNLFYILCECCDTLQNAIEPLLPFMIPLLLSIIRSNAKIHHREMAITLVGQAGVATQKSFREYISVVLEELRPFLTPNIPEDQLQLQVQTFDTLGTLFKSLNIKGNEFQLVEDVLNVALTITEQKDCGELRSGLYSMMSDCSEFMKEKMEIYLPRVLRLMEISVRTQDSSNGNLNNSLSVHNMNLDDESKVENATSVKDMKIIEEKEEALMALGTVAFNSGAPFRPFLGDSYAMCWQLSSHENNVIRAATMEALANLYIAIERCFADDKSVNLPPECLQLVAKFAAVVKDDENVDVVYAALQGYEKILNHVPQIVNVPAGIYVPIEMQHLRSSGAVIAAVIKLVITEKSVCQKLKMREDESSSEDDDDDDDDNDDDKDAEIEDEYTVEDLIMKVIDLIPPLGDASDRETFHAYFGSYQRHLLKLLEKNQPSEIREATSASLALCMKYLGQNMDSFALEFAPIFPTLMKDSSDGVRNNVAYCVSNMIEHGGEIMYSYFRDISSSLMSWLQTEKCSSVVDNICGAIASTIVSNKDLLPLNNVLPLFFNYLPLREDFEENAMVFRAFNSLFENALCKEYLIKAVEIVLTASIRKQIPNDKGREEVAKFFIIISKCYANDKEEILQSLPEELKSSFLGLF